MIYKAKCQVSLPAPHLSRLPHFDAWLTCIEWMQLSAEKNTAAAGGCDKYFE